jgi:hypothetical protein
VWRTTTRRDCLRLGWNHVRELPRGKDLHLRLARALRGQIPEEQAVPQRIPLPKHRLASKHQWSSQRPPSHGQAALIGNYDPNDDIRERPRALIAEVEHQQRCRQRVHRRHARQAEVPNAQPRLSIPRRIRAATFLKTQHLFVWPLPCRNSVLGCASKHRAQLADPQNRSPPGSKPRRPSTFRRSSHHVRTRVGPSPGFGKRHGD